MQLSEQQINLLRELLGYIEFDLTGPTEEKVHKALEALDGLRAQADARPVARFHFDEAELDALYEAIEWAKDEGLPGTAEHLQAIFDAHDPEASAPGLSVEDAMRIVMTNWGDKAAIEKAFAANLTRASAATVAEPDTDNVWPIVNITVSENGEVTAAKLYAPGLPAGNHDVYPVRVPYMDEHTEAWMAVAKALKEVAPGYLDGSGNGIECAVKAIHRLAAQQQAEPRADERAVATPFLTTQVEGDPNPAKQRFRLVAEYRSLDDMYRGHDLFVSAVKAAQSPQLAPLTWYDGEPPFPQREEWFIAETIYGERVVLRALPEEYTYDYKTADETYMKAKNVKRWMQFPDCEFLPPKAAQSGQRAGVAEDARDAARYRWMRAAWLADPDAGEDIAWTPIMHCVDETDMDSAIDAAIAAAPTQQQEGGK
ncbi:hypothetical protein FUT88_13245 [Ralstonia sp. TCR112]|uniref:hypothetical protein n=1 Tax=Ralstonia sp. TCR112 TaxID=2601730 RepID=UPI0011BFABB5|nr:hypothetical protein [Ralstonia sp. TCR112]TXD58841.1 hypothetical protein FUT88_13245 [Ralstonia sp. TCR112]